MRIVAVMPIKLNNERLPGKNIKMLGGKPLLQHELQSIIDTGLVKDINVFCSDSEIEKYLLKEVTYIKRPEYLDSPDANFTQIMSEFMIKKEADIYVYLHATAPFVTKKTMEECINAVLLGGHDSSFCAVKIQDFLWKNGIPLNFDACNLPRSQDLDVVFRETSGVYVFRKEVFQKYHRRIGMNPYIKEVSFKESIDINTAEDFRLAEKLYDWSDME